MSGEPSQFEVEVALVLTSAMQIGITAWNDPTVQAMTKEGKAEFMAGLTRAFSSQIVRLAEQKFGTKNSS